MEETRFGTDNQLVHMTLQDVTHLEKVSKYPDLDGRPLWQEQHTQQEGQPW
jgi:hypothetical protein